MIKWIKNKIDKLFIKQDIYSKITFLKNHIDVIESLHKKEPLYLTVLPTNIDIYTSTRSINYILDNSFNVDTTPIASIFELTLIKVSANDWFSKDKKRLNVYKQPFLDWLNKLHTVNDHYDTLNNNNDRRVANVVFFVENINDIVHTLFDYVYKEL